MPVSGMAHFMGHDGLEFIYGEDIHQGIGDEKIAIFWNDTHDARGQHAPLKDRPVQKVPVPEPLCVEECFEFFQLVRCPKRPAPPPVLNKRGHENHENNQKNRKEKNLPDGLVQDNGRPGPGTQGQEIINKSQNEPGEKNRDIQFDV